MNTQYLKVYRNIATAPSSCAFAPPEKRKQLFGGSPGVRCGRKSLHGAVFAQPLWAALRAAASQGAQAARAALVGGWGDWWDTRRSGGARR